VRFSRDRGSAGRHTRNVRPDSDAVEASPDRAPRRRPFGPYDLAQAPDDKVERLDLGALRIPAVAGVDIHLQAGPQGQISQIQLSYGQSRLQLGAFAAPRSEGIWDEVRQNLRETLTANGSKTVEVTGPYGVELQARVRDPKGIVEVRHVGVDGPRWFVHGVFVGAAAVDPDAEGPLRDVLRGLVVDRGTEAMPVSEALPLRLPPEAAAQLAEAHAQAQAAGEGDPGGPGFDGSRESQAT
jgi:hypothetical protein